MKTIKSLLLFSGIVMLAFILYSCGKEEAAQNTTEEKVVNVEVTTLNGQKFVDFISVVGTVKPINGANLSDVAGGRIEKFVADKGSRVAEGDTILIFDNDVLKANLDAAEAQYKLAQVTFEKQEKIYNENVSSEYEYLTAKYNRDQAKANYNQIKARYDKTFLTAPFSGIIDSKFFEEGELVPPTVAVVNLLNVSRLKIEAGIPERYAGDIKDGNPVLLYFNELFDEPVKGKISYVGKALSPSNRNFPVEVIINNKDNLIKPEMIAEVKIQRAVYDDIVVIPEEVIVRTDSGYSVYVAKGDKAEQRMLKIIDRKDDQVAIASGLKPNDKLVTLGYQNLVDGENIKIVNEVY